MKRILPLTTSYEIIHAFGQCAIDPPLIKKIPNFKAFIKPHMLKGVDHLVGHTKTQQFGFYMEDDGVTAMQFKLLCTSPIWGPKDSILVWRQGNDGKCMLPDGDPKSRKPDPMKNRSEIIKGISGFIEYWKELCLEAMQGFQIENNDHPSKTYRLCQFCTHCN